MHANAQARCNLLRKVRSATLDKCMREFGIKPPATDYPISRTGASGTEFLLNKPLQRAISELARTSGSTLSTFVEMIRGQTVEDYRPNKNLIAEEGVEVRLLKKPLIQHVRPPNHDSARARNNILRKTIRKEQDASRCLVLDAYLIEKWPEVVISPFGVVDKGNEDAGTSGRTIHDLSYPKGESVNDYTDQASIAKPDYVHCDAVATEILRCVSFRPPDRGGVIEPSAPFGWTGSPGFYEIVGGAISHVHGSQYNAVNITGIFNYH
ncbi:LOW QUALITY PROTEIN: hypothetical protein PHMEG_00021592 [Phytophthora megakarya]|uniref:Uncharacterized protein n=1 Tax=Phytophthora megakarya TaxID=4795 RepID=A0A225VKW0_9STRA|nr:LOW QUALITY PROTEIN: hypothetical protein PHMEG_00021592 [Phytophthora megakarya]